MNDTNNAHAANGEGLPDVIPDGPPVSEHVCSLCRGYGRIMSDDPYIDKRMLTYVRPWTLWCPQCMGTGKRFVYSASSEVSR